MNVKRIISSFLTVLAALTAKGQVLTDGISGRDRLERYLFIQAISPQGDTCMVMTDSLGRFEIDPGLMDGMRGNVYLKPMAIKPKSKLTIVNPYDSIHVHRQGRTRYLSQNHIVEPQKEDPVFYYDPEVTVLNESTVRAHSNPVARDKVTGYLDSLTIMSSGEWVCECQPDLPYLNDYHGYSHHPAGSPMDEWYRRKGGKRLQPKRGGVYELIKYEPLDDGRAGFGAWVITEEPIRGFKYPGPQYTEEELLEMNGMWKTQSYYPKRDFYEPDEIDITSPTSDFRNLLQWKPAVLTDENGMAEIPFGASDINTEFIGLVEAIDGTGLLGSQTFNFRIVKQ